MKNLSAVVLVLCAALLLGAASLAGAETDAPPRQVAWCNPKVDAWPDAIPARGNVMPWQEMRIGAEIGGIRVSNVTAGVGDRVTKGQVLASLDAESIETDLESARAQLTEAEATRAQAIATLERAKRLAPSGGVSQQELMLYETQRQTAEAKVRVAKAQEKRQQLRLQNATIVAPDDGLISWSAATEGAIVHAGSELFRLIRQGRLEWRAEVKGEWMARLAKGQEVTIEGPGDAEVRGKVRLVSPTIDLTTRNGLAYVDLPADTALQSGLNVAGRIMVGKRKVLAVPASAILRRSGGVQVLVIDVDDKIKAVDVTLGQSRDDWVEVTGRIDKHSRLALKASEELAAGE
jgi:HlyD family secretion protein